MAPHKTFKGQVGKDWTKPTPLDSFLATKKPDGISWLKKLLQRWEKQEDLDTFLDEVPSSSRWISDVIPQFQKFAGQECILMLGYCPQYDENEGYNTSPSDEPSICFGDVFAQAVSELWPTSIAIFARKDCRKKGNSKKEEDQYLACAPIKHKEAARLYWATRLEIAITRDAFSIDFKACVAFSTAAWDIATYLGIHPLFEIHDPGNLGRKQAVTWLAKRQLQEISAQLSQIDEKEPEQIYEYIRQRLNGARPNFDLPAWSDPPAIPKERLFRMEAIRDSIPEEQRQEFEPKSHEARFEARWAEITASEARKNPHYVVSVGDDDPAVVSTTSSRPGGEKRRSHDRNYWTATRERRRAKRKEQELVEAGNEIESEESEADGNGGLAQKKKKVMHQDG